MRTSVYSLSASDLKPAEVVGLARRHGAAGVEWWCRQQGHIDMDNLLPTAREAGESTRDAGLAVAGIAPYFNQEPMDYVKTVFEAARELGARNVRSHTVGYPGDAPYAELAKRFRGWLEQVVDVCREYEVKLVVEQHHGQIGCTPNACREFVDGLPPEQIGVIFDPGNSQFEGWTSPRYAVDVLGPYLAHVHVKSFKVDPASTAVPAGRTTPISGGALSDGDIDWTQVLECLRDAGYDGWLSLEALDGRPSEQKVSDDIPYLNEILSML